MSECVDCGAPAMKSSAGHYQDRCTDCLKAKAAEVPSHREHCDDPECRTCTLYDAELKPSPAVKLLKRLAGDIDHDRIQRELA